MFGQSCYEGPQVPGDGETLYSSMTMTGVGNRDHMKTSKGRNPKRFPQTALGLMGNQCWSKWWLRARAGV